MTTFLSILTQMLYLFSCILTGYIVSKLRILPENADIVISRLLSYVCIPAMIINSFRTHCTLANLRADAFPLLVTLTVTVISVAFSYVAAPFFTSKKENRNVYHYAISVANFGFMGNPLVQALLGEEALFHFLIITLPGVIYAYTIGLIELTAGQKKFQWRMLLTPAMIAMAIGILMGLTRVPLPVFAEKTISGLHACYAPLGMLMTGIVIAHYNPLKLLGEKQIYALALLRQVLMPLFFLGMCKLLHLNTFVTQMTIFFTAMPIGLNTIVFPAAYGGDETPGAAMAIISNVLGLITVPLIIGLVL